MDYDPLKVYVYTGPTTLDPREAERLHRSTDSVVPRNVRHVQIHPSVQEIPCGAFERCEALRQVDFAPDGSLKVIGEFAFAKCGSLRTIAIPSTVTSIQKGAFQSCFSLMSVELPKNIMAIGDKAFNDSYQLKNVAVPATINEIGDGTFKDLKLEKFANTTHTEKLIDVLKARFDDLPIHRICYYHANDSSSLKKLKTLLAEDAAAGNQTDVFGMSPLHIAALSAKPNLKLIESLLQHFPKSLLVKDEWGLFPLYYAIQTDSPVEVVRLMVETQGKEFPNQIPYWKALISQATKLMSLELTKYLVECSVSKRLQALKLPAWRQDVLDLIDKIQEETVRSLGQQQINAVESKLMWYEWKESLSLLEMALWHEKVKEATLSNSGVPLDSNERWACRVQCGDQVVISNVLPFLGRYDERNKKKRSIPLLPTPDPRATCPALRHL